MGLGTKGLCYSSVHLVGKPSSGALWAQHWGNTLGRDKDSWWLASRCNKGMAALSLETSS